MTYFSGCSEEQSDIFPLMCLRCHMKYNCDLQRHLSVKLPFFLHCLSQDLREECVKLKTRVFDLEQQNRALSILFQQRVRPASDVLLQVCAYVENGLCLCGKWPLLPTCSQQELACIQSWPASPGVRYSAPKSQSLAISGGVIKMECLSNPQLLEAAFLQRTAPPRQVHRQKEDQTVPPGLERCHRHS